MSRRRPASGATISLFPFLAVLLCTMGALLVLLVLFSRRARESDSAASRAAEQARVAELELARDDLRWRLEQLGGVRDRTAAELARERMRLAGVEEDARTLADELDALERTAAALEREDAGSGADAAVADAERRLAAVRAALAEARAAGAEKPPAYAVVPYEGAHGTHRRPLYVECAVDGVYLQPEGIRLGPADFEGPPGPGNPLASALRAAREHLAVGGRESGDPDTQPYPLLLVRPSGVMAYYAAREALVSWGSEFGYQFIDEDWELKFPPADPALAALEQRAIDESRRRIEWLAQVRPTRAPRPTKQYRASTTRGGVEAEGGPSVLGDQSRFDWTEEQSLAGDRRNGGGGDGGGAGDAAGGGDVVLGGGRSGDARGAGGPPGGTSGGGPGAATTGDRYVGPSRFYAGQPPAEGGSAAGGPHGTGVAGDAARGVAGGVASAAGPGGVGATPGPGGAPSAGGGGGGSAGGSGSSAAAPGAGAGGSGGGPALPGMAQGSAGAAGGSASGSLAGSRGSNWASLATAERPIPVTRPIRIECAAHEFRIFDDAAARVEARVPIGTRTADSVDPLVQAVHGRVGRWGLAGDRMYWRPELVLTETTDGRSRREELERLLADSGLDTRRGDDDERVRLLPPLTRTSAVAPLR